MAKKKQDALIQEAIDRIMSAPVPKKGELNHPLEAKPREKRQGGQVTFAEIMKKESKIPEDVHQWQGRDFVDYFATQYMERTGGNYRKTYRSDCQSVKEANNFLASNGLDQHEWTKKWMDWGFDNREQIMRRESALTLQTLVRQINFFYQDQVLPMVEAGKCDRSYEDGTVLLDEIEEVKKNGTSIDIFEHFGIPIAITYFVQQRNFEEAKIVAAAKDRFSSLKREGAVGRQKLERVFRRSIILSPYPDGFTCRDWRATFSEFIDLFKGEEWWRPEDYKGRALRKYDSLLKK